MTYSWIFLVLFYGISKGVRDTIKKLAMNKSSLIEVLFFHSLLAFLFIIPTVKDAFCIPPIYYFLIFLKSLIVFTAWIYSFKSLNKMPVSVYGILDVSGVVFSVILGVVIFGEHLTVKSIIGILLVISGLFILNLRISDGKIRETEYIYIVYAIIACLLNAVSGLLDKIYTNYVTPGQLQFWFMFYMVLLYAAYIVYSKSTVSVKAIYNNYWIIILSILFIIADRALFMANSNPQSKVTVMILLKQTCVVVSIFSGKFIFKERNILYKLLCSLIIVSGIVLSVQ